MFILDIVIDDSVFIVYNDILCTLYQFRDYVKTYFH